MFLVYFPDSDGQTSGKYYWSVETTIGSRDSFPEGGSMQSNARAIVVTVLIFGLMVGCSTGSVTKDEGDTLLKTAEASRQEWNKVDPQLEAFAKKGYGYAFFPEITKGGLLVGGARGRGVVYEKGQHIGYAELTQMSVGFQAGLQDYSQLIVFENQPAMDRFKRNEIDFGANAPQYTWIRAPPWVPSSLTVWRCLSNPPGVPWRRPPWRASK
jgi:hypothetical protein